MGLRPKTGLKLYKALVRPIFEYGAQVLQPPASFFSGSKACQAQNAKIILGLERGTSHACVRLMAGLPPIRARCNFLKLKHYLRILNRPVKSEFITRMLESQNLQYGFIKSVKDIFEHFVF